MVSVSAAPGPGNAAGTPDRIPSHHPATAVSIGRLRHRADFLRTAKGRRWHGKAFSLQAAPVEGGDASSARFGFTVTKKVGCSVVRNRARRRLREALRLAEGLSAQGAHDYVIVARIEALRVPFSTLQTDLSRAVRGIAETRSRDASKRTGQRARQEG